MQTLSLIQAIDNCNMKEKNAELIISRIITSTISSDTQQTLLQQIFPYSNHGVRIFYEYFLIHPEDITKLPPSTVEKYFKEKLEKSGNYISCFDELLNMVDRITADTFNKLNQDELLLFFATALYEKPTVKVKDSIEKLLSLNLKMNKDVFNLFSSAASILNNETPEIINSKTMVLACRLSKKDLSGKMFNRWLKQDFSKQELQKFLKDYSVETSSFIEHMITSVWNRVESESEKKELITIIIDNVKWAKYDYNEFIKKNKHPDMIAFITKSSGLFNKLARKIFNK
jgi:hypothetical protein